MVLVSDHVGHWIYIATMGFKKLKPVYAHVELATEVKPNSDRTTVKNQWQQMGPRLHSEDTLQVTKRKARRYICSSTTLA
ncbi:uncharacterized protein FRV6_05173 [Fusarium oxysporum]|uniref:Uncharacterized protein n=1 Tax=Fusarium oxysporum TaxID=5507 RepID=A0A2H3TD99_FUSOX|nr:uncharacterized protein FRV6_05173 [Fusarium oxysporum]